MTVLDRDAQSAERVASWWAGEPPWSTSATAMPVTAAVQGAAEAMGGLTDLVVTRGHRDGQAAARLRRQGVGAAHRRQPDRHLPRHRTRRQIMLRPPGKGSIVNNASLTGIRPTRGEGPYSAAKAGVLALTQNAALELGPAIRVNAVAPA